MSRFSQQAVLRTIKPFTRLGLAWVTLTMCNPYFLDDMMREFNE